MSLGFRASGFKSKGLRLIVQVVGFGLKASGFRIGS